MPRFPLLFLGVLLAAPAFAEASFVIQRRDFAQVDDAATRQAEATHAAEARRKALAARRAEEARRAEAQARVEADARAEALRRAEAGRWRALPYWARDRQGRYHVDGGLYRWRGEHSASLSDGCVSLEGLPPR